MRIIINDNNRGGWELWEVMSMFTTLMMVIVSQVHMYPQTREVIYREHAQLLTCQLSLNKVV